MAKRVSEEDRDEARRLHILERKSDADIAKALGMTENAVDSLSLADDWPGLDEIVAEALKAQREGEANKADQRMIQVVDAVDALVVRAMKQQSLKPSDLKALVITLAKAHKLRQEAMGEIEDRANGLDV